MNFEDQLRGGRQQFTRLWTEQLYKEYESICYLHKLKMGRPVLRIDTLTSRWGLWDPVTRTITIASQLIESYNWDVVIEILKHEMAHQMVTDLFGQDEAHGPCFSQACQRLGVSDWASRCEIDLATKITHWKDRALGEPEERLLKKVEKLLSLATSSNEHEALLAMQRVRELYAKHNLDRLRERRDSGMVYLLLQPKRKRIERHESLIGSILSEHFSVKVIYSSLYDPKDLCEYKVIELLGARENVLMAEYVYHFLWDKIHQLWDQYRQKTRKGGRSKHSYLLGVLWGFRERLDRAKKGDRAAAQSNPRGERRLTQQLVAQEDRRLQAFVSRRHPRLVTRRSGGRLSDGCSYSAGIEQGLKLTLNKPISQNGGNRGLLLDS
jgi:Protein of unknown function (DUF2786)/SprT-like family